MASIHKKQCVLCGSPELRDLVFVSEHGAPHGGEEHVFTYGYVRGASCTSCGAILFESFDHDCFQYDEPWNMAWFAVLEDRASIRVLENALQACPDPFDAACTCAVHAVLGHSNIAHWGQRAVYRFAQVRFVTIRARVEAGGLVGFERDDAVVERQAST